MTKVKRFKVGDQVKVTNPDDSCYGRTVTIDAFYTGTRYRWDYYVKHPTGTLDAFEDSELDFIPDHYKDALLYAIQQVSGWHKQWDTHYQNSAVEQAFKKCLDLLENLRDHGIPPNADNETNETKE